MSNETLIKIAQNYNIGVFSIADGVIYVQDVKWYQFNRKYRIMKMEYEKGVTAEW